MPAIYFRVMNTDMNTQDNPVGNIIGALPLSNIIKAAKPAKQLSQAPTVVYLTAISPNSYVVVLSCGIIAVIETLIQRFSPTSASAADPLSAQALIAASIQQSAQTLIHLTPRIAKAYVVPTGILSSLTAATSMQIAADTLVAVGSAAGVLSLVNCNTGAMFSWIAGFPVQELVQSSQNDNITIMTGDDTITTSGLPVTSLVLSDAALIVGTSSGTLLHHSLTSGTSSGISHIPDLLFSHTVAPSAITAILSHPHATLATSCYLLSAANGVVYTYRPHSATRAHTNSSSNPVVPIYASDAAIVRMATVSWANILTLADSAGRLTFLRSTEPSSGVAQVVASPAGGEGQWTIVSAEPVLQGTVAALAVDAPSKVLLAVSGGNMKYTHLLFKTEL